MLRTIGGLDKIRASQSHLAQASQATSYPDLDTPYTPPTHFFLWARENVNQQFQLLPSYLCVEYMETWCFRRWMTSPEAPGLLTEAAGEWCARPQWWWTAGLGGARPGHRWAVGHCRPGHPTASAGLRPHCTADQSFQRWNPLQNILQGPLTNRFSADQKNKNKN